MKNVPNWSNKITYKNVRSIGVCMYMHNYMHTKSKKEFPINFAKKNKEKRGR